jgi:hypothetical protein
MFGDPSWIAATPSPLNHARNALRFFCAWLRYTEPASLAFALQIQVASSIHAPKTKRKAQPLAEHFFWCPELDSNQRP